MLSEDQEWVQHYLKPLLKLVKELKLNGMCWQVLDWNTPAINFYHKYGAEISSAWLNGKLTKKQIETLCSPC